MTKTAILGQVGLALLVAAGCSSSSGTKKGVGANGNGATGNGSGGDSNSCVVNCQPDASAGGGDTQDAQGSQPDSGMIPLDDSGTVDACQGTGAATEPIPVALQMVVDVSSSMKTTAPGTSESKWTVTRNALVGAMGSLPSSAYVGVQFFPDKATLTYAASPQHPRTDCVNQADNVNLGVLGGPGSAQRTAIDNAFARVFNPPIDGAGTPTLDAYYLALAPLVSAASLPPDRYMLLITDGQPTYAAFCVGNGVPTVTNPTLQELTDPIVAQIQTAAQANIKTFVIGSPGSEQSVATGVDARSWLSQAARAGGTASSPSCSDGGPNYCHFDMTQTANFSQDLSAALTQITRSMVPCIYKVTPPDGGTLDPTKVSVEYTAGGGQRYAVVLNQSSDCQLGWHYTDSTYSEIEICGSTCEQIKHDPLATMNLYFGCSPPVIVT
jgi:hypothetical protein